MYVTHSILQYHNTVINITYLIPLTECFLDRDWVFTPCWLLKKFKTQFKIVCSKGISSMFFFIYFPTNIMSKIGPTTGSRKKSSDLNDRLLFLNFVLIGPCCEMDLCFFFTYLCSAYSYCFILFDVILPPNFISVCIYIYNFIPRFGPFLFICDCVCFIPNRYPKAY